MKFQTISLAANVGTPIAATGTYFRVLSGTADFRVTFQYADGSSYDTLYKVGIGVKLPKQFVSVTILSTISQTIEIAYSFGIIDDSRLVGNVGVTVSAGTSYDDEITAVTASTATKIVSENGNRLGGTLYINVSGYLWHDNTVNAAGGSEKGIPYTAGDRVQISNTAEMWFMTLSSGGQATLLEEIA